MKFCLVCRRGEDKIQMTSKGDWLCVRSAWASGGKSSVFFPSTSLSLSRVRAEHGIVVQSLACAQLSMYFGRKFI